MCNGLQWAAGERIFARVARNDMKNRIKLNALALIVGVVFCAVFPYLLIRRTSGWMDDTMEMLGFALILLGLLLRISARGYKAEHSSNGNQLVTGGPYSLVRNPMYLGIIICGTGAVLAVGQWWALIFFLGGFLARYLYLFEKEEKALKKLFGPAYERYAESVPRILPNLRAVFTREIREYLPLKGKWIRPELVSIVPVIGVVIAVECWESFTMGNRAGAAQDVLRFLAVALAYAIFALYLIDNKCENIKKRRS
jgi:protein-S-isoprenylcysteine O-methyltransferase Ste14